MSTQPRPVSLDLTRDERWVVHHMMLDILGFGPSGGVDTDPFVCTLAIVEKLERDRTDFSPVELDQIRDACQRHASRATTPECDRDIARDLVRRIEDHEGRPPSVSAN